MDRKTLAPVFDVLLSQKAIDTDGSWKEVIDNAGIGISVVAKDGTYLYVNKIYSQELGYTDQKEIAPGVFVPELFFTNLADITVDIPPPSVIKALESGFKFGTTRAGHGDYNTFRKEWRHKLGHTVTGICRTNLYQLGAMPAMYSWISFAKNKSRYRKIAKVKELSVLELRFEKHKAYSRIRELDIEIKERSIKNNYVDSDDCKTCGKPK